MAQFVLTCCSTVDMSRDYLERRNIPYVCFHYNINGKDYSDDLGLTMSFAEFYGRIAEGALPTTSQVNVIQFVDFFEPFLKQEQDILHISLSSGLSGTYGSAQAAAKELMEKYPNRKIQIVDSLGASSGYGLLVDMACDMRDAGASMDEIYQWLGENKLNIHHWFFSTDLSHFKRGGRISGASAMVATLFGLCPLLNVSCNGKLITRSKVRGKKNVIKAITEKMLEHAVGGKSYAGKCFISNSACYQDARQVADLVESSFPNLSAPVTINSVGTVIGSHTGPGTVALFFVGDKRTD